MLGYLKISQIGERGKIPECLPEDIGKEMPVAIAAKAIFIPQGSIKGGETVQKR